MKELTELIYNIIGELIKDVPDFEEKEVPR